MSAEIFIDTNVLIYIFLGCMILAAAHEGKAGKLFSEGLNHGQILEGIQVINPFA